MPGLLPPELPDSYNVAGPWSRLPFVLSKIREKKVGSCSLTWLKEISYSIPFYYF